MRFLSGEACTRPGVSAGPGACFANNSAVKGGALYVDYPTIWNASEATFVDNYASDKGGGMSLRTETWDYHVFLDACLFVANAAGDGGALSQESRYAGFRIGSSVFTGNYAGERVWAKHAISGEHLYHSVNSCCEYILRFFIFPAGV